MTLQHPVFHQRYSVSQHVTLSAFPPHFTPHTSVRRRTGLIDSQQPGLPSSILQAPRKLKADILNKRTMGRVVVKWAYDTSLTALDTWSVTYYAGCISGDLLYWTYFWSLAVMDTWPVTYCDGHMTCHLLRWTHFWRLTALDTFLATYCTGHIFGHLL